MDSLYRSNTTQCPICDSGIFFTWDVRNGVMQAGMTGGANRTSPVPREVCDWCADFNFRSKHFTSLHEASRYVERYNTWFHAS